MSARLPLRQAGLTLTEMMVAIAIGLAVVLAAARLLALANGAYAAQLESAALDDAGRYAVELVARAVRQAAHADPLQLELSAPLDLPAPLAGLDARSLGSATADIAAPLPAVANGSDVLAVRFPGAGGGPGGDGSVLNCAGFGVGAGEEGWSIFYVAKNGDGEAELRCKYRGAANWSADAVVTGVDSFQLLYGLDTDTPRDGAANRYVNADAIRALDAALGSGLPPQEFKRRTWWKRVVSVRIALLLHGARPTRHDRPDREFALFGATYAAGAGRGDQGTLLREDALPDGLQRRERRLFLATVALPAGAL
ncbi:PilW family protein [Massilia sp. LXY-6]|uniref:PilW family protein n=1 Tax=Massilia sp. LXY-6 TaxID=3379823 RepID=UPI003EDFB423